MGDHFNKRFPGLRWIIHDGTRHSALMHEPGSPCRMVSDFRIEPDIGSCNAQNMDVYPPVSVHEKEIRSVWRVYFREVAIGERTNSRLQNSRIPIKYRTEMTEFGASSLFGHEAGRRTAGIKNQGVNPYPFA